MAEVPRNREAWLTEFAELAMPLIKQRTGLTQGSRVIQLSCGFPSKGGRKNKRGGYTSGECHHVHGTDRTNYQIFIHPARTDPYDVAETVMHETLHALLAGGVGHGKPFSQAAKKLGLVGKPTSTELGDELRERVGEIVEQLGSYPHEKLEATGKIQSTRMVKIMCPICGYIARTTDKWLNEAGAPICPQCGISFEEGDAEATMPLTSIEQTVAYAVKATAEARKAAKKQKLDLIYDPRWHIRMHRKGSTLNWWVIDYGPSLDESGKAIFGTVMPRLTHADSRDDAVALLEALRDGTMTYDDIEDRDNDPSLLEDSEYMSDEEYEGDDVPESTDDPRFSWEVEKGITIDDVLE